MYGIFGHRGRVNLTHPFANEKDEPFISVQSTAAVCSPFSSGLPCRKAAVIAVKELTAILYTIARAEGTQAHAAERPWWANGSCGPRILPSIITTQRHGGERCYNIEQYPGNQKATAETVSPLFHTYCIITVHRCYRWNTVALVLFSALQLKV